MPEQSQTCESELVRAELEGLIRDFKAQLEVPDLRTKVRALIPAFRKLRDLGSSLAVKDGRSARDRILRYLLRYPLVVIDGEELMVVSGIQDWPRRVRELRVQFGWRIISGVTANEMLEEGELPAPSLSSLKMAPDQYMLLSDVEDREAAHRWHLANEVRRMPLSVQDRTLEFFRRNIGQRVTGEELRYVAKNATEWARRVRELRTEHGWPIVTRVNGREDLPVGVYVLEADRQSPAHDRSIPDVTRREVLRRDQYTCQECSWTRALWTPDDARHLEIHHIHHHSDGGGQEPENLVTLCHVCHDVIHSYDQRG